MPNGRPRRPRITSRRYRVELCRKDRRGKPEMKTKRAKGHSINCPIGPASADFPGCVIRLRILARAEINLDHPLIQDPRGAFDPPWEVLKIAASLWQ